MRRITISFADKHPELISEWSDRNEIRPEEVSYGANTKVLWKGACGHEWYALVKNRGKGCGCPVCSSNLINPGINDFKSKRIKMQNRYNFSRFIYSKFLRVML